MNRATGEKQGNATGTGRLVYVVDDEPMLLELSCVILQPLGYSVRTFRDPQAALSAFSTSNPRPALLITDYSMHNMDGMALIEACRRLEPDQKVLLISGTVGREIMDKAGVRPDGFLAKPYHARQLIEVVKTMTGP
jgi:CheY-like chemotaxis protein